MHKFIVCVHKTQLWFCCGCCFIGTWL